MRRWTRLFASYAALLAVATAVPAHNLNFLKGSPIEKFTPADYELMMKNAQRVLESEEPNARGEWRNPDTGSFGSAQVRSQFIATDGALCKRLQVANEAGVAKGKATYSFCKYKERGWLIHPDAVPAGSEKLT